MADLSRREYTWRVIVALSLAAAFFVVWRIGSVLMLIFGGAVIAVVIRLAADPVARVLKVKERWASVLVLLAAIGVFTTVFYFFGNAIVEQFGQLRERLPEGLDRVYRFINGGAALQGQVSEFLSFSQVISALGTTYGFLVDMVLVLLIAVYLAFNPSSYRRGLLALVPATKRELAEASLTTAGKALKGWLRGQLVAMATVGLLTGLGLWLIGVPLALVLGLIAGVLEFIPIVGPFMAAVPGILLAFTHDPMMALYAALVYIAVQQLETNLITPIAQRWAVSLPPALGLVGLMALGGLFGLPGLLFAAPLTVVLMTLVEHLYLDRPAN